MLSCPIPENESKKILLAHGGGGKLTHQLIERIFLEVFDSKSLNQLGDSALLENKRGKLAFTTDSYVVQPIFFPGGNIGELAVNGTVNDLAVSGAVPLFLSAGFIIEEGLEIKELWEIVVSMKNAADRAGVEIVTGDTKVVEKGKGDKVFINTSGIGIVDSGISISPKNCTPGDKIILSGKIGDHGISILTARNNLNFESGIISDTAPLNGLISNMLQYSSKIKMMRDITRGGLSAVLNEIACNNEFGLSIEEENIPVNDNVLAACELLGLDPLYIANEGKLIAVVDRHDASKILKKMKDHELGRDSEIIGEVTEDNIGRVIMNTVIGTDRIIDMMSGEQLPRIC